MATRTTVTAVREVLDTTLKDKQVRAFIVDASVWVTDELKGTASAERLEVIERYLACALCRLRDLGLKSGSINDVSEQYQVDPDVTDYLLRAAGFDSTGKIRQHFLAEGGGEAGRQVVFGFGTGFKDEPAVDDQDFD